jgi:outer membrane protein assembly factor BamB
MLRNLWSIPFDLTGDRFTIMSGALYATTADGRLTAYDLRSGAVHWSRESPEAGGWLTGTGAAGVLLMPADRVTQQFSSDDGGSYLTEYFRETVALDARTGAELWRGPGQVNGTGGDSALLVDQDVDASARVRAFRLVGLRDGAPRWTIRPRDAVEMATSGADPANPDFLVTVSADGRAQVLRMADGARVATGQIDYRPAQPDKSEFTDFFADQRNVYVRTANGRGDSLTAYDLGTLHRIWRIGGVARVAAYACARVVCGVQPDGVEAFDPGTGRPLWRATATQDAGQISTGWLMVNDGRSDRYALIEAATGRRIGGLGPGTPIQDAAGTTAYLLGRTLLPDVRTSVSRIDLATGAVALRGTIDRVSEYGCTATADLLACVTGAGRLAVVEVGR